MTKNYPTKEQGRSLLAKLRPNAIPEFDALAVERWQGYCNLINYFLKFNDTSHWYYLIEFQMMSVGCSADLSAALASIRYEVADAIQDDRP